MWPWQGLNALHFVVSRHNHHYRALDLSARLARRHRLAAMRPELPVVEPITRGLLLALFSVAVASIGGAFFLGSIPSASPALLQSLATIGAIFVPAYVVEVVWLSAAHGPR